MNLSTLTALRLTGKLRPEIHEWGEVLDGERCDTHETKFIRLHKEVQGFCFGHTGSDALREASSTSIIAAVMDLRQNPWPICRYPDAM
jgi:hypothetical protein